MKYKKDDFDLLLAHPDLLALTNKFIQEFLNMASDREKIEKEKDNEKFQRSDGYYFDYLFTECLVNCDYLENNERGCMNVFMDMGFVQNIIQGFFERNVFNYNFNEKIQFILNNFDKQEEYSDWRFENLEITEKQIIVEDINDDWLDNILSKNKDNEKIPAYIKVEKTQKTCSFTAHNSKSGYEGKCEVIFINNKLDETLLYRNNELQLTINERNEPRAYHYSYVSDINGFINVMDQVLYGIEETLEEKSEEE